MQLLTALIYWLIVGLWLGVLGAVAAAYWRNPRTFGAVRLLLAVVAIDTTRNIVENVYFGLYFGAQYGLFSNSVGHVLGKPQLLILPKIGNVVASLFVLGLLLMRWLSEASKERAQAVSELSQAEWRFRVLVEGVKEYAIYLLDREGRITSWNSGAERIKGYRAEEILGLSVSLFYTEEDRQCRAPEQALRVAEQAGRFETNAWRVRKDGSKFWASIVIDAIRAADGAIIGFAMVTKDITEQRLAEEKLKSLALFDQLTGLPNRASLLTDLAHRLEEDSAVSVAKIDLDGFKNINDTLGQFIGDCTLREVASRLSKTVSGPGQVYRTEGDAFVAVLPTLSDPIRAKTLVLTMLRAIHEPFEIEGRRLFIGASAGIAIAPAHGATGDELITNADLALHEAKQDGGRRATLFIPSIRAKVAARQEIETELRRAFAEREFVVYYQPQFRLKDGVLVGAEALLRWRHPSRGLLLPGAFIEALGKSPVAVSVGTWILETACQQVASWREAGLGSVRMGVNLFPDQFHDPSLLQTVEGTLAKSRITADLLELEITENIAFGREDASFETLGCLRKIGVGLAFDDFGTGYASLSYLTRYPLTRIKIDRSFVSKITDQATAADTAVVRSMIVMSHNLGLKVIAEGVETKTQAEFLRMRMCEEAQGYLYAKPLASKEFEEFLSKQAQCPSLGISESPALEFLPGNLAG